MYLFGGIELLLQFFVGTAALFVDFATVMECFDIHFLCDMRRVKKEQVMLAWSDSSSLSSLS